MREIKTEKERKEFWDAVVDGLCECGHLQSEHNNEYIGIPFIKPHGKCTKCECKKFVWIKHIMRGDKNDKRK